ncbi:hypothetical protein NC653_000681 [Populus alba x Populus x berolinensis]|uniref:Uncharacterized protein n=1 Tax=Populus alba x Populus x berolinensis TaxID=444605 RepID=A0AAD6RL12_9ROSI|nr:hypothetical protein NC653_000681 [Populus alba x Populus x berolinensis]
MSRPRWSGCEASEMLKLLECVSYSVLGISSSSLLVPPLQGNHISKPFHASLDHFYAKDENSCCPESG